MIVYDETALPPAGEWDAVLAVSDDAWLFHSHRWLEATSQVFELSTVIFLARDGGNVIAAWPVQAKRAWGQAFSVVGPGGPVFRRDVTGPGRASILSELARRIERWARSERIERVSCALPPLAAVRRERAEAEHPLAALGWRDTSTSTRVVRLDQPAETLWAGLASDARRTIRRAWESGYRVEQAPWGLLVDDYVRLHRETYRRTGTPPHPRAYFAAIAASMASAGHAVLWVALGGGGETVAFHNSGRFQRAGLYWTGCSATEHLRNGVNYALMWEAMLGARDDGCAWYDVGEIFPDAAEGKARGLSVFKSKFGGEVRPLYRAQLSLPPTTARALLRRSLHWGRRALARLRSSSEAAAGA